MHNKDVGYKPLEIFLETKTDIQNFIQDFKSFPLQISNKLKYHLDSVTQNELDDGVKEYLESLDEESREKNKNLKIFESDVKSKYSRKLKSANNYQNFSSVMAFVYLVSAFDSFVNDFVKELYLNDMRYLITKKKNLSFETILKFNSIEDLKNYMLDREIMDFGYYSFSEQVKYISNNFNISLSNTKLDKIIESIIEIKETRNIHVHNRGIINEKYKENIKNSTFQIGSYRDISDEYLESSIQKLNAFAISIHLKISGYEL